MPENYRYPLAYTIDPEANATAEELAAREGGGWGGCDQLLLIAVMGQAGNGEPRSQANVGFSGGPDGPDLMSDIEKFECWIMLAHDLMLSPELPAGQNYVCRIAFELLRSAKLQASGRRELALKFARKLVEDLENAEGPPSDSAVGERPKPTDPRS